ncbi:MAG: BamA/TamA family outer membrane protein [Bacteroidales bacterium]|nr:BamA/TamA family outer membrane protein [Bacteroidales bacterium]
MKKNLLFLSVVLLSLITVSAMAQSETTPTDSLTNTKVKKEEKTKSGWSFGGVPAIAFDSDIGFKYGAVVNFYDYGDGTIYPEYKHSIYLEWSRTTKGSGINQFIYDSKYLIPNIRMTAEASYLTEQSLDFYGFNGYEAFYDHAYEDDDPANADYVSRLYFRQERKMLRLRTDFQGNIIGEKLRWLAGIEHYNVGLDSIDYNKLNKGKDDADKLPEVGGLYADYVKWGVIPDNVTDGGKTTLLKLGLVYDTRDNEPNPMHGIWTEMQFLLAPSFLGNKDYHYSKFAITHRQYFTLVDKTLSFAYRVGYQAKLSGDMPFYMLPFVFNTAPSFTRDGLGGAKTIRGILRNRIVGEDLLYGNFEVRWKFLRTVLWNQNLYLALNTFTDMGMVTGKYEVNTDNVPLAEKAIFFPTDEKEKLHVSYGAGIHIALNENFIVAIDYGRAVDPRDGESGLYIGLNFLY